MMKESELVEKVRQTINEADDDSAVTLLTPDRRSFDDNIKRLLPRAVAFVQKNKQAMARVNVKAATPSAVPVVGSGDGAGYIVLPADFVSPVSLSIVGWKQPCTKFYSTRSHRALLQRGKDTRAGFFRPVCVEDVMPDGVRCVRLYPLPQGSAAVVENFVYEATYNAAEGLGICDAAMADAVVYECAALLYTMFERFDTANMYHSIALSLCGGNNMQKR